MGGRVGGWVGYQGRDLLGIKGQGSEEVQARLEEIEEFACGWVGGWVGGLGFGWVWGWFGIGLVSGWVDVIGSVC